MNIKGIEITQGSIIIYTDDSVALTIEERKKEGSIELEVPKKEETTDKNATAPLKEQASGTSRDIADATGVSRQRVSELTRGGYIVAEKDNNDQYVYPNVDRAIKRIKQLVAKEAKEAENSMPKFPQGTVGDLMKMSGQDANSIYKLIRTDEIESYKDANGHYIIQDLEKAADRFKPEPKEKTRGKTRGTVIDVAMASGTNVKWVRRLAHSKRIQAKKNERGKWIFPDVDGAVEYIKRHQHKNPRAPEAAPTQKPKHGKSGSIMDVVRASGRSVSWVRRAVAKGPIPARKDEDGVWVISDVDAAIKYANHNLRTDYPTAPNAIKGTVRDLVEKSGRTSTIIHTLLKDGILEAHKNRRGYYVFPDIERAAKCIRECGIPKRRTPAEIASGVEIAAAPIHINGSVRDLASATGVPMWKVRRLAKEGCITSHRNGTGDYHFPDMASAIDYLKNGTYKINA